MNSQTLLIIIYMTFGQTLIYTGLLFLSERLLPNLLNPFYATAPHWLKLILFAAIIVVPANLLFAQGYKVLDAGLAGAIYVTTAIVIMVITALLVEGIRPNLQIFLATLALCASAVWLVQALKS